MMEKSVLTLERKRMPLPLRRPLRGDRSQPVFQNPGLQIRANELEHTLVGNLLGQATHEPILTDAIEELLQIEIYHIAVALLQIRLGLGHRLRGGAPGPKALAGRGKRRVPFTAFS